MWKITLNLAVVIFICSIASANAGPNCQNDHMCHIYLQCMSGPSNTFTNRLRDLAKNGIGQGLGDEGSRGCRGYATNNYGVENWDTYSNDCDPGNNQIIGWNAFDAYKAGKADCAPYSQWRFH